MTLLLGLTWIGEFVVMPAFRAPRTTALSIPAPCGCRKLYRSRQAMLGAAPPL